jgi:siroheme synthase-like protein
MGRPALIGYPVNLLVAGRRCVVVGAGRIAARKIAALLDAGVARRIFVNAADDPERCSFTLMSVVRQGDLVVTIGTGGRSPALATYLKDHVASEMGPEWGVLLDLLSEERERLRGGGTSSETLDWRRALDSGMLDLIRTGRVAQAKELLRACLSSSLD